MLLRSAVIAVVGLAEEIDHVNLLQMKVHEHTAGKRTVEEVEVGGNPACLSSSGDCTCSVPPAQICSNLKDVDLTKAELKRELEGELEEKYGQGKCLHFAGGWIEMNKTNGYREDVNVLACMDTPAKDVAQMRLDGGIAVMNMACGTETEFDFSFEYYGNVRTIADDVALTFYDLDEGVDGDGQISVQTCGQNQTLVAEDTNLKQSVDGNCVTVTSNVDGDVDAPTDPLNLDSYQLASAVTYTFSHFKHIKAKVSVTQCASGIRNILWSMKPAVACAGGDAGGRCPLNPLNTTTTTTAPATTIAPVVGAEDDPHLTDTSGDKFDLYQDGRQTLLVIPKGASKAKADLHIRGTVEKHGERENDLWIRSLAVSGKWVPGGSFQFKTADGIFNSDSTLLVRHLKTDTWKSLNDFKDGNLLSTSDLDEAAPTQDFGESLARKVTLQTGPVKVLVNYGTAQKNGEDVNHLDLHVEGLGSVASSGGLLSGEVVAFLNRA